MTVLILAVLVLILLSAGCFVGGVFLLFGVGHALLAAAVALGVMAVLLSRGVTTNG